MSSVYDVAIRIAAETKDLVKEIKSNTGLLQTMGTVAAGVFAAGMIRDAATELYTYGTGIDTIREKLGLLSGVQGDALNKITGSVKAIGDIWDKDYNEVIKTSNVLTKQLGADSDKAMKLIQQGMASGGDATGDFLQQVSEYAPMFKDAGLSAESLVAIVTQSVTSGIFSDKGADAIKESMLRIREMTTATEDALAGIGISSDDVQKKLQDGTWTYLDVLKLVSKKLGEFPPQSKKVGTAIADIFGGAGEDAGLDYLKTQLFKFFCVKI
ncbi:MAG: phage tail tape measure protein, partial [Aliivibrio sp.]|uniref:phage tail tape measure protein n=1 Tax=Aliivibrio sp. TaxID=1872443 RepID=UPI001A599CB7|nr:phage tail tape measure protein [Aliivibrio sp.]